MKFSTKFRAFFKWNFVSCILSVELWKPILKPIIYLTNHLICHTLYYFLLKTVLFKLDLESKLQSEWSHQQWLTFKNLSFILLFESITLAMILVFEILPRHFMEIPGLSNLHTILNLTHRVKKCKQWWCKQYGRIARLFSHPKLNLPPKVLFVYFIPQDNR